MMNRKATAYLDEDTYEKLKVAKSEYAKEKGTPDREVKMSEFIRYIIRTYLK